MLDYLRFILKNAVRNRRRTVLTVLSVAVSVFLLVSLRTLLSELEGSSTLSPQSSLRLVIRHSVSLNIPLPLSYRQQIEQVPGVELVTPFQWFGGYYQDPKNFFAQFGVDPGTTVRIATDYAFHPAEVEAFKRDRTSAIVAGKLMDRFGWKVGERITIVGMIFPFNLELVIAGTYTGPDETGVYFHYDYFNELLRKYRPERADRVGTYWIKVRSVEDVPRVAAAVDQMFRNTDSPTKTETEKAFNLSFTSMLGNIKLFMSLIAAAVVFAIFLVTMNTMAMAVRERRGEIAVLKTLGFTRGQVLGLLVGESMLIAVGGGVVGVVGAKLVFGSIDLYKFTQGIIQHFNIDGSTIALGMILAGLVGMVSAAVPAWRVVNTSIAGALRQLG